MITGGSTGLGYAIAQAFLAEGANVAICGRNEAELSTAGCGLNAGAPAGTRAITVVCDVSREEQVRGLARGAFDEFGDIIVLVNNAGVIGPIGKMEEVDFDEWRGAIETNLFGAVLACRVLLPHFRSHSYGKIVNLSGGGNVAPPLLQRLRGIEGGGRSLDRKPCGGVVRHGNRCKRTRTRLVEHPYVRAVRAARRPTVQALRQKETGGASIERAAELCVYLASAASDGITRKLISAPWDPWQDLDRHREELRSSDIYTLRRILPENRAKNWN